MAEKTSTTKRFGARYGVTLRKRVGVVEAKYRTKQKCPYCRKLEVKRVSLGIWQCRKCKVKFTGRAYEI